MSKIERTPFAPISADLDDDLLEQLAREKGVGTLERPAPTKRPGSKAQVTEEAAPAPAAEGATPRSRMKPVNLELPDYAWTELKIRAAKQQTSLRHVVMTALRKDGIEIAEIDMNEDGRRQR